MAITIRELITRFGFEVDEKGAKDVEKRVDGMKKGFGGLGKLLGVTIGAAGARAFWNVGQATARARFELERLTGTKANFDKLQEKFKAVKEEIDGIKTGASDVIKQKDFDIAAAGFIKVFGRGKKQVETFGKLFSFAAKQAALTGANVNEIMQQLQSGIQGGDFSAFLELPGFDVLQKQMQEAIQGLIDPGDIGGRIGLENRLKAVMKIISEAAPGQKTALGEIPDQLLEADKAAAQAKSTMEQIAASINKVLVPAIRTLNIGLERFNELLNVTQTEDTTAGKLKAAFNFLTETPQQLTPAVPIPGRPTPSTFPGPVAPGGNIEVNNIFHINGIPDAMAVGKEVKSVFDRELKRAKDSIVKTED